MPDVLKIEDHLTKRDLPERQSKVLAAIIHTTGDTDIKKILAFYTAADGLGPHYMIGLDGLIYRIADESRVAYHCVIKPEEARLYSQGWSTWCEYVWKEEQAVHTGQQATNYREWRDSWFSRGLQSPLNLVTGAHPNSVSVGIELQQPEKPGKDIFTDAQYASLAGLLKAVSARHGFKLDRQHLLGHYDCSPMRRSTAAGSWDPGRNFSFNRLFDLLNVEG